MQHDHTRAGGDDKTADMPQREPAPDVESTEGGQSGREIIPDADDDSDRGEAS